MPHSTSPICRLLVAALVVLGGVCLPYSCQTRQIPAIPCEAAAAEYPISLTACRAATDGDARLRMEQSAIEPLWLVQPLDLSDREASLDGDSPPSAVCHFALRRCAGVLRS